jgi:hypothetical protein
MGVLGTLDMTESEASVSARSIRYTTSDARFLST